MILMLHFVILEKRLEKLIGGIDLVMLVDKQEDHLLKRGLMQREQRLNVVYLGPVLVMGPRLH